MPTRIRVVIAFVVGIAALTALVPVFLAIVHGSTRPQVVITIPKAAAHSPLPYSTPFPNKVIASNSGHVSSASTSISQPNFNSPAPLVKYKKPGDGTVDINTASLADFEHLPGIGPAMAARILTARSAVGRFRKPSDLLEVRGIGPKKFSKMRPFIVVN